MSSFQKHFFYRLFTILLLTGFVAGFSGCKGGKLKTYSGYESSNRPQGKKAKKNKKSRDTRIEDRSAQNKTPKSDGPVSQEAAVVISTARTYVGTPYKYGGNTRAGLDCSGLMVLSFKKAGKQLPRVSRDQANAGKTVSRKDIQPGDLVFFAFGGGSRIDHVGLVTQTDGQGEVRFIHSTTKLGVTESNLSAPYYSKYYVKAVRVEL